jgi:hypothetical protein
MYKLINMQYNVSRATPRCEVMRIGNTYDPVTKRITSLNAFDPLLPPGLKRTWTVPMSTGKGRQMGLSINGGTPKMVY